MEALSLEVHSGVFSVFKVHTDRAFRLCAFLIYSRIILHLRLLWPCLGRPTFYSHFCLFLIYRRVCLRPSDFKHIFVYCKPNTILWIFADFLEYFLCFLAFIEENNAHILKYIYFWRFVSICWFVSAYYEKTFCCEHIVWFKNDSFTALHF